MLYIEYHAIRLKYTDAQRIYDDLINEKETLFARTQPQAVNYDKDRVSGGSGKNAFEEYVIAKESTRIDERLAEQNNILDNRKYLLDLKERELRASKFLYDKIYVLRYLDNLTLQQIENRVPYSRVQIWRILKTIKLNCGIL